MKMLKFGLIKNVFHQNKYICRTNINQSSNALKRCLCLDGNRSGAKEPELTMRDVKVQIMKRLGLDMDYTLIPKKRDYLTTHEPKLEDLPSRTMQDSFTSAIVPLSTDKSLQNKYVAALGHVRLGRLMEDMDLFAVWVCHKHVHIPKLDASIHLPYTFVTILVDKMHFTKFVTNYLKDIRLSGHVSWVGRTSLEIVVWLEQKNNDGIFEKITRGLFLMAARNATNTKAAPVNPLKPGNDKELEIFKGGEDRKTRRIESANLSLYKVPPKHSEQNHIHELFMTTIPKNSMRLNRRILPPNCKWMKDTIISNTILSFPENRNAHNKVFGGYLMKQALEISWMCATQHCNKRPILENICDISFKKPVGVASIINMTAHVVYTTNNYLQIMVIADILNFEISSNVETSNVFYFTFSSTDKVMEVIPKSYYEAMWYIQGQREYLYGMDKTDMETIKN